jgi:hypothetical protein
MRSQTRDALLLKAQLAYFLAVNAHSGALSTANVDTFEARVHAETETARPRPPLATDACSLQVQQATLRGVDPLWATALDPLLAPDVRQPAITVLLRAHTRLGTSMKAARKDLGTAARGESSVCRYSSRHAAANAFFTRVMAPLQARDSTRRGEVGPLAALRPSRAAFPMARPGRR